MQKKNKNKQPGSCRCWNAPGPANRIGWWWSKKRALSLGLWEEPWTQFPQGPELREERDGMRWDETRCVGRGGEGKGRSGMAQPPSRHWLLGVTQEAPFQSGPPSPADWGGFFFCNSVCRVETVVAADTSLVRLDKGPFQTLEVTMVFWSFISTTHKKEPKKGDY